MLPLGWGFCCRSNVPCPWKGLSTCVYVLWRLQYACCLKAATVYAHTQVNLCVCGCLPSIGRPQWSNVKIYCECALTEGTHLSLKGVYDEVQRVRLDTLDTLLHHVVTVLVLHTLQHMAVQFPHHLTLQGGGQRSRKRESRARGRVWRRACHSLWEIKYCLKAFSKTLLHFSQTNN